MRNAELYDEFMQLPPTEEFTFADTGDSVPCRGLHHRKLFLGGSSEPLQTIWAYLKIHKARDTDVVIYVLRHHSFSRVDYTKLLALPVNQIIYPFRILAETDSNTRNSLINALVLYYFLESGEAEDIFIFNPAKPLKQLRLAVEAIAEGYDALGGADKVPNTFRPTDLSSTLTVQENTTDTSDDSSLTPDSDVDVASPERRPGRTVTPKSGTILGTSELDVGGSVQRPKRTSTIRKTRHRVDNSSKRTEENLPTSERDINNPVQRPESTVIPKPSTQIASTRPLFDNNGKRTEKGTPTSELNTNNSVQRPERTGTPHPSTITKALPQVENSIIGTANDVDNLLDQWHQAQTRKVRRVREINAARAKLARTTGEEYRDVIDLLGRIAQEEQRDIAELRNKIDGALADVENDNH